MNDFLYENDDTDSDDYYALLGLDRKATKEEINAKYRHLSRLFHPDKHSGQEINQAAANSFFNKIKTAHEVLIDDRKRLLYDNLGSKGVNADNLPLIPFVDTQDIKKEFERLIEEKEKRALEQRLNPKGSVSVGFNISDFFDIVDEFDEGIQITVPECETNQIVVNQSIDVPLNQTDVATVGANVAVQKGRGVGALNCSIRRILSSKSWCEGQISVGDKNFVNCNLYLHAASGKPGIEFVFGRSITQEVIATVVLKGGLQNSIEGNLSWERNKLRFDCGLQMGLKSSLIAISCSRKIEYNESKARAGVKYGTSGIVMDYSCETKLTQNSRLALIMSFGFPAPVILKLRINRANQTFIFPILLYEEFLPSAVVYGTLAPVIIYSCIMKYVVNPFVENKEKEDILRKRSQNNEKLLERRKEAEAVRELLKQTYEKVVKNEIEVNGLIIDAAFYGKASSVQIAVASSNVALNGDVIDVKLPMQCLVRESQLIQPAASKVNIPGFYDPCFGEEKVLYIKYSLNGILKETKIPDNEAIYLTS